MNQFTLRFSNPQAENQFGHERYKKLDEISQFQKWLLITIAITYVITTIIAQNWIFAGFTIVCLAILSINIFYINQRFYCVVVLITLVLYNLVYPVSAILKQTYVGSYYDGYITAVGTMSLLNSYTLKTKSVFILIFFLANMIFNRSAYSQVWFQILCGSLLLILTIGQYYFTEKSERIDFLKNSKNNVLNQKIYSQIDIQSFVVHYDFIQNQFNFVQYNQIDLISIEQQNILRIQFLRNIKVRVKQPKLRFSYINSENLIDIGKQLTMEEFLFYLFTDRGKITKLYKNDKEVQSHILTGMIDIDTYQIEVIECFDIKPSVIILISENKKDTFIEELKLRNAISKRGLESVNQIFRSQIRMCLIYFTWIYKYARKQEDIKAINCLLRMVYSKLTRATNDFQNLIDFCTINTDFERTYIQKFNAIDFIQQILKIVEDYDHSKNLQTVLINRLSDSNVKTDQKQLKQLLLNILFFAAHKSQTIHLEVDEVVAERIQQECLRFKIIFQGPNLNKVALNGLPIINPQKISELRHNSEKSFDLELPIALMIVRKLGPYDKIRLKQSKNHQNYIEFYIFKELKENFHLIPIISMHPKTNLVTRSSTVKQFKSDDNFDMSPRIQFDTYREF